MGEVTGDKQTMGNADDPVKMLQDIVERYYQLQGRDATNHEFACCIYSADALLARVDPNYKQKF